MIGDKIKLLREARGLTQQQISQDPDFGIKQGTLSAYERNAREPNVETIRLLSARCSRRRPRRSFSRIFAPMSWRAAPGPRIWPSCCRWPTT